MMLLYYISRTTTYCFLVLHVFLQSYHITLIFFISNDFRFSNFCCVEMSSLNSYKTFRIDLVSLRIVLFVIFSLFYPSVELSSQNYQASAWNILNTVSYDTSCIIILLPFKLLKRWGFFFLFGIESLSIN